MNVWMESLGSHIKIIQRDSLFREESDECINFQPKSLVKGLNLTVTEGGALVLIQLLEDR